MRKGIVRRRVDFLTVSALLVKVALPVSKKTM